LKLIKLRSNKESFHTVEFSSGLNFIVGRREDPNNSSEIKTFNGVGKSLIVTLIHFCLGSSKIDTFESEIKDWIFYLEFETGNQLYLVERSCANQGVVILNNEKMPITKYTRILGEIIFELGSDDPGLSFRALIKHFIRPKSSYSAYNKVNPQSDYYELLCQSYLLGLSVDKVREKYHIKKNIDQYRDMLKELKKNPIVDFQDHDNLAIVIADLEEEIRKLDIALQEFQVAHNYHDLVSQADTISKDINQKENNLYMLEEKMRLIQMSLEMKTDISCDTLVKLYSEAQIALPSSVVFSFSEVEAFHNAILKNRYSYLSRQFTELQSQKSLIQKSLDDLFDEKDNVLKYLNTHGALDEYTVLSRKASDDKIRLTKMTENASYTNQYNIGLSNFRITLQQNNIETSEYLSAIRQHLAEVMSTFRSFSKHFYGDTPGGISIDNNIGENVQRYVISAEIQSDSSDGIGEVKIFCFDMTLLLLHQNHSVDFIFHDSRLFGNMDPRQQIQLIIAAEYYSKEHGIQYIASVNEDMINSFHTYAKDDREFEECSRIIQNNTILTLTDKDATTKLLGIQVNLVNLD
jgi:uncharacterized protein YydD (DUF2326 family)